jgi:hypothetical protein
MIGVGTLGWLALYALDKGVRLLGAGRAVVFAFLAIIKGALVARETGHATTLAGAGIIGVTLAGAAIRTVRRTPAAALKTKDSKNER